MDDGGRRVAVLGLTWLGGLARRRRGRLVGVAAGVALAVGLLASLGSFVAVAKSDMTRHAGAGVLVDWQVEAQPGTDAAAVLDALKADPSVQAATPVAYAATTGLQTTSGGTTQSTGPGVLVGMPADYGQRFPGVVRPLAGSASGVVLAQQTAANLHAAPGDTVVVGLPGGGSAPLVVEGVVDIAQADSFFQKVGAAPGSSPVAPPDNVVLMPSSTLASLGAGPITQQVHVRLGRDLPRDPAAAFVFVSGQARNLEVRLAGGALVGDNLGAALGAARQDSLYAQLLFGLPGAAVAMLLTRAVAASGATRRRRELAVLRARGATASALASVALTESVVVAVGGGVLGLAAAWVAGRWAFGSGSFGTTTSSAVSWAGGAFLVGVLATVLAVFVPARREAQSVGVVAARAEVTRDRMPFVLRWGIDVWLLLAGGAVFWLTSRGKYALVLAPEGVPAISVSYWSLAGPLLLWAGIGLFGWRLVQWSLGRRAALVAVVRRFAGAGSLARPVASSLRRQRRTISTAGALLGLTLAFGFSTAAFNATYRQQVEVDAVLTNGADVTVSSPPGVAVDPALAGRVAAAPGVGHVEAVDHRFVYVGADLQDLYGVNPATVVAASRLQDSYVAGGSVRSLMATMARDPSSALVSAETVTDFRLQPGDTLRLRVRDGLTGALVEVPFHYAGVVKEFPTAPTDSFVVVNSSYVAAATGGPQPNQLLVSAASGWSPSRVAASVRSVVGAGSGATVTDLDSARRVVGSSLTAVDLAGLTRLELSFALVLSAGAAGLVLLLGFAERRRTFSIIKALGARRAQLRSFLAAEALVVLAGGVVLGGVGGWVVASVLVKVLTGVFDPPPSRLAVPWGYVVGLGSLVVVTTVVATSLALSAALRPRPEALREL
jgi:putative ABC transport system permease protein